VDLFKALLITGLVEVNLLTYSKAIWLL